MPFAVNDSDGSRSPSRAGATSPAPAGGVAPAVLSPSSGCAFMVATMNGAYRIVNVFEHGAR
jgi:hypothetical protein